MRLLLLVGLFLSAAGIVFAILGAVVGLLRRRRPAATRKHSSGALPLIAGGLLLTFVVGPGSCAVAFSPGLVPEWWLSSVARHGDVLVAGIRRFETDKGHPPAQLAELVPDYLSALPSTGFAGEEDWEYTVDDSRWSLVLPIDSPFVIDFDEFRYDPSGSTDVPVGYGRVVRHGNWLYMDE